MSILADTLMPVHHASVTSLIFSYNTTVQEQESHEILLYIKDNISLHNWQNY